MTDSTIIGAVQKALDDSMSENSSVLVLGEDVARDGGVFRATQNLYEKYGNERVIDTPLAESGITGLSIGLSLAGFRPVAEIQFSGFLTPAYDQIVSHLARMRNRTRGRFSCPVVIRTPYGGGIRAPEHHSESMESIYVHIPGLKVIIPSTPSDTYHLLRASIMDNDPVLFLEPKRIYRSIKEPILNEKVEIGKAKIIKEGTDLTLITYGAMRPICQEVVEQHQNSIELIDLRTLSPMDNETIIASVNKTGRLVVVHEAPKTLGLASEIFARVLEHSFLHLESPPIRVTGYDTIFPLYKMEKLYLPDHKKIRDAIDRSLSF